MRTAVLGLVGVLVAGASASAQEGWVELGRRQVALRAEQDTIQVGAVEGRFRRVRFAVEDSGVEVLDVTVTFVNGESCELNVAERITAGSQTRAIDLPGAARGIRSIRFRYRSNARRGRATVIASGWRVGEGAAPDVEWALLGERVANYGADRDRIPVGVERGRFRRIQLRVAESGVRIWDVWVYFENGECHEVQVRNRIEEGERTRVIDLPGGARRIDRIELTYRTQADERGRARVRVFGVAAEGEVRDPGNDRPETPAGEWQQLGTCAVNFRAESDTVEVSCATPLTRVGLTVEGNDVRVRGVRVHFANGGQQELEVRDVIQAGGRTRAIDLRGEARRVVRVELLYNTQRGRPGRGRATLTVWGR